MQLTLPTFPSRIIGQANFKTPFTNLAAALGPSNSIRADEGQPLNFAGPLRTGADVTITGPVGSNLQVGRRVRIGQGAVVLAGKGSEIGDGTVIAAGAVVNASALGNRVSIGKGALVVGSTLKDGTVVPPGAIIINNVPEGQVQR